MGSLLFVRELPWALVAWIPGVRPVEITVASGSSGKYKVHRGGENSLVLLFDGDLRNGWTTNVLSLAYWDIATVEVGGSIWLLGSLRERRRITHVYGYQLPPGGWLFGNVFGETIVVNWLSPNVEVWPVERASLAAETACMRVFINDFDQERAGLLAWRWLHHENVSVLVIHVEVTDPNVALDSLVYECEPASVALGRWRLISSTASNQ